ncbi:T9SS type A sorting domain-containing protein, partial [Flavobacterium sp. XGLA_31]|uniref:T9SS type A sorting domain-containing protein n=1 Tax=Flavobacterium sp. XGLA_31 TaxID=3447666 RepID=UPI003F31DF03
GFSVSGGCAPQGSFAGTPVAPILCQGGTTSVTYNVTDKCYSGSVTRTFTVTAPAEVTTNAPANASASACAYADQADVDAAFAAFLNGFSVSGGCDPQGSFAGTPVAPTLCQGGTTSVTYNVTDKCYSGSVTRTFTVTAPAEVITTAPDNASASACAYADQAAVNAAFAAFLNGFSVSGGCTPKGEYGEPVAPVLCTGGTTTVTYTVTDKCYSGSVTRTFTVTAPATLAVVAPTDATVPACAYSDQASLDVAFAEWLSEFSVSGGCDPQGNYGQPVAPDLCIGGTTTVVYTVNDKCQIVEETRTFTVNKAAELVVVCPGNKIAVCGEDAASLFEEWKGEFDHTGGCPGAVSTDLTQFILPQPGQSITITFTVTDGCQTGSCTARFEVQSCGFCTYTQGYYGNVNGAACTPEGNTTNAKNIMLNAMNGVGGTYNFGSTTTGNYFRLTLADIVSNNIFKMLPGGKTPRPLVGFSTFSMLSTWTDSDPLTYTSPFATNYGRINNVLLAQTMTMFFNSQLNEDLGAYELTPVFVTAATTTCGSHVAVPGTEQVFTISQPVIDYLNAHGGATAGNLFVLANKALGGENISPLNCSQVNAAVDAINRGYDGCRVLVGTTAPLVTKSQTSGLTTVVAAGKTSTAVEKLDVKVYPNPYTDNFNLSLTTASNDKVVVAIYDMLGRLIETRDMNPSESTEVMIGNRYPSGVYNVIVTQGEVVKTLRVVKR